MTAIRVKFKSSKFVNFLEWSPIQWQKQTTQDKCKVGWKCRCRSMVNGHGQQLKMLFSKCITRRHKKFVERRPPLGFLWQNMLLLGNLRSVCKNTCSSEESFKDMIFLNIGWWLSSAGCWFWEVPCLTWNKWAGKNWWLDDDWCRL